MTMVATAYRDIGDGSSMTKYNSLSLIELIERIAHRSDARALAELHDHRRIIRHDDKRWLLAEYLDYLRQSQRNYGQLVLDRAYDITLGKFFNIPSKSAEPLKSSGPDCRYYFMAFLEAAENRIEPDMDVIRADNLACTLLQRHVYRHFRLSVLDCVRTEQELVRRYNWHIKGAIISLNLPVELPGSICNRWLCQRFPDIDPDRPGERDRLQTEIDRTISQKYVHSLCDREGFNIDVPVDMDSPLELLGQQIDHLGLAETVAAEKAENIELQRPAVRTLGPDKLRGMILQIFTDIAGDSYSAAVIAERFGISKPSLCRFAGTRWHTAESPQIPDLWKNTAQVLCSHSRFNALVQDHKMIDRILTFASI